MPSSPPNTAMNILLQFWHFGKCKHISWLREGSSVIYEKYIWRSYTAYSNKLQFALKAQSTYYKIFRRTHHCIYPHTQHRPAPALQASMKDTQFSLCHHVSAASHSNYNQISYLKKRRCFFFKMKFKKKKTSFIGMQPTCNFFSKAIRIKKRSFHRTHQIISNPLKDVQ